MPYLSLLLAWGQNKAIWTYLPTSRQNETLDWGAHCEWWRNRPASRLDWIIMLHDQDNSTRPIGHAHAVDMDTERPEVGLYIGDISLWDKGLGYQSLRYLQEELRDSWDKRHLYAMIHPENERSRKLFEACGFHCVGESGRNGQEKYEYDTESGRSFI